MFNPKKRQMFSTVGELVEILKELPAETPITICGDNYCYYHEELDGSAVCLDCEDMEESYAESEDERSVDT